MKMVLIIALLRVYWDRDASLNFAAIYIMRDYVRLIARYEE